jgi:WD40 repeat protein
MRVMRGHTSPVWTLAYSPDGRLLASGSADRTLRLWDMLEGRELTVLRGHLNTVVGVAFSPDGESLASASRDKRVRLWDVGSGQPRSEGPSRVLPFTSLAFFPDGRSIAAGTGLITCVAIRPDGTVAAGSGYPMYVGRGAVMVWDVEPWFLSGVLELSDMGHWRALRRRERHAVELGGSIRVVKLWQPGSDVRLPELPQRHPVAAVAFSADGTALASGAGRTVTLWNPATGQERGTLKGHVREVSSLAFTPDGAALLSGGIDRTVRLWDVGSGRPRATYGWPTGKVYTVDVAPDGLTAAAAGDGSDIVVWDLEGS